MIGNNIIKTIELLHLNEAAKALKQKDFQIINNYIIGLDNIDSCIKYIALDNNLFYNESLEGSMFNTRELSAFIKAITTESEFIIKDINSTTWGIYTNYNNSCLTIKHDMLFSNINYMYSRLNIIKNINNYKPLVDEINISSDIEPLFSLNKDGGCYYYKYDNKYFMTLFSGLLPLNKSDKVYLTIYFNNETSFIAKYRVNKKKFNVYVLISYKNII